MRRAIRALIGDQPELMLTPMIDCVFLLLIFFVLSFHFRGDEGFLRWWLPDRGIDPTGPILRHSQVRVGLDYDVAANACQALLDFRNEVGSAWDPELRAGAPRWDEIREYVRAARDGYMGLDPRGLRVVIDASARTPVKFVVRVLDICTGLGVPDIWFAAPEIPIE